MKLNIMTTVSALALIAGSAAVTLCLSTGATPVAASSARNGQIQITKNCSAYTGGAGSHCTITSSNLAEIPAGTTVYYDQAAGIPNNMLDSNVVLYVSSGNWATGRCTLDSNNLGVCTFSDGTGPLTGFTARVNVAPLPDGVDYTWTGTYSFTAQPVR
jgi:hypothetical protein